MDGSLHSQREIIRANSHDTILALSLTHSCVERAISDLVYWSEIQASKKDRYVETVIVFLCYPTLI